VKDERAFSVKKRANPQAIQSIHGPQPDPDLGPGLGFSYLLFIEATLKKGV
jgi:hypothetical protein